LKALVRRPGPRLAEGLVTHVERRPVDAALALRQWERYVEALRSAGREIVEAPPADDCPDGVFVEDVLVVHDDLAVLTRPGAAARRAEVAGVEELVAGLVYALERIADPGTLDGGDVLRVGETVYVGVGGRTNAEGVGQLRAVLEPRGARVVAIPVGGVLHLKTAVTALPDGSLLGHVPSLADPALLPGLVEAPEPSGANVVLLGGGSVLVAADCPETHALLARRGLEPVPVDVSELQKLEAGVTCLSVLLPGARPGH
jgi:dimethylargininase